MKVLIPLFLLVVAAVVWALMPAKVEAPPSTATVSAAPGEGQPAGAAAAPGTPRVEAGRVQPGGAAARGATTGSTGDTPRGTVDQAQLQAGLKLAAAQNAKNDPMGAVAQWKPNPAHQAAAVLEEADPEQVKAYHKKMGEIGMPKVSLDDLRSAIKSYRERNPGSSPSRIPAESVLGADLMQKMQIPEGAQVTMLGEFPVNQAAAYNTAEKIDAKNPTPWGIEFEAAGLGRIRNYVDFE